MLTTIISRERRLTLYNHGKLWPVDSLPHVTPLDTTGAGDSFIAGFLSAQLTGADTETAARAGHAVAVQVLCHLGALIPMQVLKPVR